jgi:thioredoxin-related protein
VDRFKVASSASDLNSKCQFCTDSLPFYRRLVSYRGEVKAKIAVVALTLEEPETLRKHLVAHGVEVDQVASVAEDTFRLRSVPTIILVDRKARVLNVWTGRLASENESTVFDAVRVASGCDA